MKKTLVLTMLSCLLASGSAFAAEPTNGVYIAPKLMLNFSNTDASISANGQSSSGDSFSDTTMGGALAVGYDFDVKYNVPVRTELEFAMGDSVKNTDNSAGIPISGEIGINSLMLNVYYDFENTSKFTPYVGLGAGIAWVSMEGDIAGVADFSSKTQSNFAWNVGLGVAYDVAENFSVDLGYRYAQFGDAKTATLTAGANEARLEADSISAHQVMCGLRYTF